jgi:hypothetical protein
MSHEDEKIVKAIRTDGYKDVTTSVDFSKIDFIKICSDHKKELFESLSHSQKEMCEFMVVED